MEASPIEAPSRPAWCIVLRMLLGWDMPALPELPGRVHVCPDAPMSEAELDEINDPAELARCAAISKPAALKRLQQRDAGRSAEAAQGA